jgi:hypothetical protein
MRSTLHEWARDLRLAIRALKRVSGMDNFMAPRWFKTVTRKTWNANNVVRDAIDEVARLR